MANDTMLHDFVRVLFNGEKNKANKQTNKQTKKKYTHEVEYIHVVSV